MILRLLRTEQQINMEKKLRYFNLNGLAESVRYILHYSKQKFEDVRYDLKDWPIASVKNSLPFGQLPLYEEGKRSLNQSLAIARYVATQAKLLPTDAWDQAVLDAIAFNIYDFWYKVLQFIKENEPTKKEMLKKEILTETVDYFFSRFEKELKENNGFFNGKLSWVDFVLVGIVESSSLFLGVEVDKKYPTIVALGQKIRSLPGVKEYVASRKPYTL